MNKEVISRLKIDLKFDINLPQRYTSWENFISKSYLNEIQLIKMFVFSVGCEQLSYLMNYYMLKDSSAFPHFFFYLKGISPFPALE